MRRSEQGSGSEPHGIIGGIRDLFSGQRAVSAASIANRPSVDDDMLDEDDDEVEERLPSERGELGDTDDDEQ